MNGRTETVGESRLFRKSWREGRRSLIPAQWIFEPCYETGKNVWHRIGLAGWHPYCVAGIWKRYEDQDGRSLIGMSMLTVNADGHPLMSRMHKPNDEKRFVVIVRPEDYAEWLTTPNIEAARAMLQPHPAEGMAAEPAIY
ncbi:DUF159 family protein [Burkholderia sp. AU31652]|nr:DUF159 family protein [Burkholderia sp. AU31652]